MDTIGVIGTSSLAYQDFSVKTAFTLACILNSWLWLFALATLGHMLKSFKYAQRIQVTINRASAVIMWVCALLILRNMLFIK